MFKNSKIVAIRHVMSPSVGISFIPDFSKYMPNYYYYYKIDSIRTRQISKFANNIYGTPSPAPGKSVVMNLALRNNFEMKYKAQSDTGVNEKKISLLDNLDFQANYDFMADSFNLSNISMSTSTRLFGEKLSLNINGTIDPYKLNENGRRINSYVINDYKKIGRLTSLSLSISTSFNSSDSKSKQNEPIKKNNEGPPSPPTDKTQEVDFSVPWNLSLSYSLTYSKPQFVSSINHSATFNGNITLTKKWSFTFNGTYDFTAKEMVTTSIGIVRDLHCWQMSINVIPFGRMQSYFFTINAKANILRDLKYTKNNEAWRSKNY